MKLNLPKLWTRIFLGALLAGCLISPVVQSQGTASDYIEGVVTSSKGPEAGVWVVAETMELPTRFIRSVVTDDKGQYVIPELPRVNYEVFVRGYGLVDSPRVKAKPGQHLNLTAVVAPDGKAAAQFYPASYWLSLMDMPKSGSGSDFGTPKGCIQCHQLGDRATREIPEATRKLGNFKTTEEVWDQRVKSGPSGAPMSGAFASFGPERQKFADWTDRIAAGEYPKQAPTRPQGIERNVVVTLWDWGTQTSFMHTVSASDKRDARVNANGLIVGGVTGEDLLIWLDPQESTVGQMKVTSDAPFSDNPGSGSSSIMFGPSPYWGTEPIWKAKAEPRSMAYDEKGRVWYASRNRAPDKQPDYCKAGANNKFGDYYPLARGSKQVALFEPKTKQVTPIDTCVTVDHNHFAEDKDNTLFFGMTGAIGWVNTRIYDETHDVQKAQGWVPGVLDTNGDGKITKPWTEPDEAIDPAKDHRVNFGCYSIATSPKDNSLWCTGVGATSMILTRVELGSNPPETSKTEVYAPPPGHDPAFFMSGGVDVDSDGVAWVAWRGSDQLTSFDRRKCKVLNGPTATGAQCPEGWSVYRKLDEPTFRNSNIDSDFHYLMGIERHGALGLGKDIPFYYSVNSDAVVGFLRDTGKFVTFRVPYPMGFYPRGMHERIDDPNTGWKGRGFWSNYSTYTPWHIEGGKGQKQKVVKIQLRPDPLAK